MTGPIDTLRTVADTLGQAHVHPVKVQVTAHHNGPIVDILTATRTDLFALCDQTGTRRAPCAGAEMLPGPWVLIGGGPAYGGGAHVVMVTGVRADGTLDTVEGGKLDPGNPRTGAEKCTAILADHREVYRERDGSFWMRDAGTTRPGRRVIYWCWTGDLPTVRG